MSVTFRTFLWLSNPQKNESSMTLSDEVSWLRGPTIFVITSPSSGPPRGHKSHTKTWRVPWTKSHSRCWLTDSLKVQRSLDLFRNVTEMLADSLESKPDKMPCPKKHQNWILQMAKINDHDVNREKTQPSRGLCWVRMNHFRYHQLVCKAHIYQL